MNFQDLKKIENADTYLDIAFRKAKDKAKSSKKYKDPVIGQRESDRRRIQTISGSLQGALEKILKTFPTINDLPPFYLELVKLTLDYPALKRSLGALNWASHQINEISRRQEKMLRSLRKDKEFDAKRREYYGRVSSVMKQVKDALEYLEESRKVMRSYPNIKTGIFTVAIAGYPNAGKSSILRALTTAEPEVNVYPFTTKRINLGYMVEGKTKVQLIDIPGLLSRKKKNLIEMLSILVLKHVAQMVIFVFDCSEQGFDQKRQYKLYKEVRYTKLPMIPIINKADLPMDMSEDVAEDISKLSCLLVSTVSKKNIPELKKAVLEKAPSQPTDL